MSNIEQRLLDALGDARGVKAADRLCEACVDLIDVDAAALSLVLMVSTSVRSAPAMRGRGSMTRCSSLWVRGRAWTQSLTARR